MKRQVVIAALKANHGDQGIPCFLSVERSFMHKIRKELELFAKRKY